MVHDNRLGISRFRTYYTVLSTTLRRYGIAIGFATGAILLRLALNPVWGSKHVMIVFFPVVLLISFFVGPGPGIISTILCAAAMDYFWMTPAGSWKVGEADLIRLATFAGIGFMFNVFSAVRRHKTLQVTQAAFSAAETAEQNLQLALQAGRMGIWRWSIDSGEVKWSPGLEAIHGYASGSFPGTFEAFKKEVHPDDRDRVLRTITEAVESGNEYHIEYRIVRPDGMVRWVEGHGQPFWDSAGRQAGLTGVCSDITERRQAAEAEQRAKRSAEEANRAKDEFLAMLSHELRTPLTSIIGWVGILKLGKLPLDEMSHALEVIERNAWAENQLVESLLDLSRITAGKLQLDRAPVDLSNVVEGVVDSMRPVAELKGVTLQLTAPTSPVMVNGDAGRLQQIFSNLISNAVTFTMTNGYVHVRLARIGSQAAIHVIDNGKGISPEFLPLIFERFRQAESDNARTHGGLGLGLAIVRELVQAHGGSIVAESRGVGRGSTFTVTLPVSELISAEPASFVQETAALAHPSISGLRVLIVDDDADAREIAAVILESCGALVQTASSAREAVQTIDRNATDVLIADIGMPQEDGYALIRKLRALEFEQQKRRLPAIALTAFAGTLDCDQALEAGYDLHIAKPVARGTLTQAVAKFVKVEERPASHAAGSLQRT